MGSAPPARLQTVCLHFRRGLHDCGLILHSPCSRGTRGSCLDAAVLPCRMGSLSEQGGCRRWSLLLRKGCDRETLHHSGHVGHDGVGRCEELANAVVLHAWRLRILVRQLALAEVHAECKLAKDHGGRHGRWCSFGCHSDVSDHLWCGAKRVLLPW